VASIKKAQEGAPPTISRRDFVTFILASGILYIVPPAAISISRVDDHPPEADPYSFVDNAGLGPRVDAPVVEKTYIPIHDEEALPSFVTTRYRGAEAALRALFAEEGQSWDDTYRLNYSFQHYGVCEGEPVCQSLLRYCKAVQEYLYDRLDRLLQADLRWELLLSIAAKPKWRTRGFRGVVGRYTYYLIRVSAVNEAGEFLKPYLVAADPVDRALHYIVVDSAKLPIRSVAFITPGPKSLIAPFSELIHLSTHAPALRYAEALEESAGGEPAREQARIWGETVTESAAILLAHEYMQVQQQVQRLENISAVASNLSTRFPHMADMITYMRENGIQEALDIWMDRPGRLVKKFGGV